MTLFIVVFTLLLGLQLLLDADRISLRAEKRGQTGWLERMGFRPTAGESRISRAANTWLNRMGGVAAIGLSITFLVRRLISERGELRSLVSDLPSLVGDGPIMGFVLVAMGLATMQWKGGGSRKSEEDSHPAALMCARLNSANCLAFGTAVLYRYFAR